MSLLAAAASRLVKQTRHRVLGATAPWVPAPVVMVDTNKHVPYNTCGRFFLCVVIDQANILASCRCPLLLPPVDYQ